MAVDSGNMYKHVYTYKLSKAREVGSKNVEWLVENVVRVSFDSIFGLCRFEVDLRRVGSVQKIFARRKLSLSLRSRRETTSFVNGTLANLFQHFTLFDFSRKFC